MRSIYVNTVARSDFGLYRPLLNRLASRPDARLGLLVSGSHLVPEFGMTVTEIEREGFPIVARLETLLASDSPAAIARSMGIAVAAYAQEFARQQPDMLVVLGDRFDMMPAALAALPFKIPIAHIHGGELSGGAIDDPLRHCMTKLSHLHFVSSEDYARRVRQLGEQDWRVHVVGALGLDNLREIKLLQPSELEQRWRVDLSKPFLLVTFHPVTLEYEKTAEFMRVLFAALDTIQMPVIATLPNADTSGRQIIQMWTEFAAARKWVRVIDHLGTQSYFSFMKSAAAMLGNSSSGLLEAASFNLPVVNIGSRQDGRARGANVIDTGCDTDEIVYGAHRVMSPAFRDGLCGLKNLYDRGGAAEAIVRQIMQVALDETLLRKHFSDWREVPA